MRADVDTTVTDEQAAQKRMRYFEISKSETLDDGSTMEMSDKEIKDAKKEAKEYIDSYFEHFPKIKEFMNYPKQVNLAISLHAPNNEIRNKIGLMYFFDGITALFQVVAVSSTTIVASFGS